jgi:hypothetical protein
MNITDTVTSVRITNLVWDFHGGQYVLELDVVRVGDGRRGTLQFSGDEAMEFFNQQEWRDRAVPVDHNRVRWESAEEYRERYPE